MTALVLLPHTSVKVRYPQTFWAYSVASLPHKGNFVQMNISETGVSDEQTL